MDIAIYKGYGYLNSILRSDLAFWLVGWSYKHNFDI